MKSICFCLVFICSSFISYSQTQYDLNTDALKEYNKAEKKLNKLYHQIINKNEKNEEDTLYIVRFKRAQNVWIKFRDAQLEAKFPAEFANQQGSARPTCYLIYKTFLTEQRSKEFIEMIISQEGDVCR